METYYFTFGQAHTHPTKGIPMKDHWVEIQGTFMSARAKMMNAYGEKWAFQYKAKDFDPLFYPKGRYELIK